MGVYFYDYTKFVAKILKTSSFYKYSQTKVNAFIFKSLTPVPPSRKEGGNPQKRFFKVKISNILYYYGIYTYI